MSNFVHIFGVCCCVVACFLFLFFILLWFPFLVVFTIFCIYELIFFFFLFQSLSFFLVLLSYFGCVWAGMYSVKGSIRCFRGNTSQIWCQNEHMAHGLPFLIKKPFVIYWAAYWCFCKLPNVSKVVLVAMLLMDHLIGWLSYSLSPPMDGSLLHTPLLDSRGPRPDRRLYDWSNV